MLKAIDQNKKIRRAILHILLILCMITIFCFSAQNSNKSTKLSGGVIKTVAEKIVPSFKKMPIEKQNTYISNLQHFVRKSAHASVYCLLGVLSILTMFTYPWTRKKAMLIAFIICFLYACSDEFHQLFVSGRSGQISDVIIDSCGALIGILTVSLISLIRNYIKTKFFAEQ